MKKEFNSLTELTKYFSNKQRCVDHLALLRWEEGKPACVYCGSTKVYICKGFGKYKCADCKNRFNIITGTFFENTKLPLTTWFVAMYLCLSRKKGTSSHQLARDLNISQPTAWFVLHRIRALVTQQAPGMLFNDGMVEADECYIGGKDVNRHANKKKRKPATERNNPVDDKHIVAGIVQRGGKVITRHVGDTLRDTLEPFLHTHIAENVKVVTDEHVSYKDLRVRFDHHTVKHYQKEYVRGDIHTNTIENYWSVVKRCVYGTYHHLSGKHLQSYLNEFSFRYDTRKDTEHNRFNIALKRCEGRLKYTDLIAKQAPQKTMQG